MLHNRKCVVMASYVVSVFILLTALFSFLSRAVVVMSRSSVDKVSVSDCTEVGFSMSLPPDMENGCGKGTTFSAAENAIDRSFKTGLYFIVPDFGNSIYNIYCGNVISAGASDCDINIRGYDVMLC